MSAPDQPPSLQDLGARIAKVRNQAGRDEPERKSETPAGELGLAWRISIEIVVALALSTGLGWVFDQWLGTTPWLMVVFLFLGAGAGVNNAVRTMNRMDRMAAERAKGADDVGKGPGDGKTGVKTRGKQFGG